MGHFWQSEVCLFPENCKNPIKNIFRCYSRYVRPLLEYVHMFTWEAKWNNTGLRFQTGMKASSVHMKFHFSCISKQPNILMDMCRHFILGGVYIIFYYPKWNFISVKMTNIKSITAEFQTQMHIKHNIQWVCGYSFLSFQVNLMPVSNFILMMISLMWNPYHFEFY